jgi:CRISPR-associated protein Cas5d
MKPYTVEMEIEGPFAMFRNPASGSALVSYPMPPASAVAGIFSAVARLKTAVIVPRRVELCSPIRYVPFTENYRGMYRKSSQIADDNPFQSHALLLQDVCYRLYGECVTDYSRHPLQDSAHALQDIFNRRLKRRQCAYPPALGQARFLATYWGPFREGTIVREELTFDFPGFLSQMWDKPIDGKLVPKYVTAHIERGVLNYAQ